MKTKRVNRYYCDYCKKSGCSSYHMKRHEETCTNNPGRKCRMHVLYLEHEPETSAAALAQMLRDGVAMGRIRELSNGCPMCILSAIRQSGLLRSEEPVDFGFDYKKERESWFRDINEKQTAFW